MVLLIREIVVMDQVEMRDKLVFKGIWIWIDEIDSIATAQREIGFFFPEFDIQQSLAKYENLSFDRLKFNRDTLEHEL